MNPCKDCKDLLQLGRVEVMSHSQIFGLIPKCITPLHECTKMRGKATVWRKIAAIATGKIGVPGKFLILKPVLMCCMQTLKLKRSPHTWSQSMFVGQQMKKNTLTICVNKGRWNTQNHTWQHWRRRQVVNVVTAEKAVPKSSIVRKKQTKTTLTLCPIIMFLSGSSAVAALTTQRLLVDNNF